MDRSKSAQFIEKASGIASYYGFRPLRDLDPEIYRQEVGRSAISFSNAAVLCTQCAIARREEPVLAYWVTNSSSHPPPEISAREAGEFSLHVAGCAQSMGEIVILKTVASILTEWGIPIVRIRLNAMGDRDSRERFARELTAFVRRRFAETLEGISEEERLNVLREPLSAYASLSPVVHEIIEEAPRPVHFLSERSRTHFKELLEYLEQVELPYELDDTLAGDSRQPRVAFRIDLSGGDSVVLASTGGRYDDFVGRLAGRREPAVVHASIYFRKQGASRGSAGHNTYIQPKIYFIQLGVRAKLRGLRVIDTLRREHIPIGQSFDTSRLSPQLSAATAAKVSYVIIMGEREALDGTVIVRSTRNSSQTIVELQSLPKYLRGLKV